MSFLKIDKKNIFSFSKIVLVIAFVAIFSFGFSAKVCADTSTDTLNSQINQLAANNSTNPNWLSSLKTNLGTYIPGIAQINDLQGIIAAVDSSSPSTRGIISSVITFMVNTQNAMSLSGVSYAGTQAGAKIFSGNNNATAGSVVAQAATGVGAAPDTDNGQCWAGSGIGHINFKNCFYQGLYYAIFWPLSWLVGLAGWLFGFVFEKTVIGMSEGINNIGAIDVAWKTMRDLANIGFIFILLYLAISTILGVGEHDVKKTLSKLVIVAILLNFSLFFTKIIIDASNILAIAFYHAIAVNAVSAIVGAPADPGIGGAFMGAFRLSTLFDPKVYTTPGQAFAGGSQPLSVLIGGSVAMLIAIAILISALMMFVKRYIILVLVMIFSPLAFAGMVLHQTEHSVHEWWNYLLKEAFFAPVYMILLWISFSIINDTGFLKAIEGTGQNTSLASSFPSTDGGNAPTNSMAGVLLDFMIVSALLIASLIAAEHMGVVGAEGAMHTAQGIIGKGLNAYTAPMGALYRNTVGAGAYYLKEKAHGSENTFARWMRDPTAGSKFGMSWAVVPALRGIDKALESTAGSSLRLGGLVDKHEGAHDGSHGQEGSFSNEKAKTIEGIAGVEYELRNNPEGKAKAWSDWIQSGFGNGNRVGAQKAWEAKGREEQAEILAYIDDMGEEGKAAAKALRERLSVEERDEVDKIIEVRPLSFQTDKLKKLRAIRDNEDAKGVKGAGRRSAEEIADAKQAMRDFAQKLTSDQFIDLEQDLILDDDILSQADTQVYEQLQRKNKISKKNKDLVSEKLRARIKDFTKDMDKNMHAAIDRRDKTKKTEDEARADFLDEMQKWWSFMDSNASKWWGGRTENEGLGSAIIARGGKLKDSNK